MQNNKTKKVTLTVLFVLVAFVTVAMAGRIEDRSERLWTKSQEYRGSSPMIFEGSTNNAYETTFTFTDPTADRTITFPNLTGTVGVILGTGASTSVPSTLATNGVDAANSIWGGTNQVIAEGATANTVETILTFTDPTTADKTVTFADATGTVMLSTLAANGPELLNSVTGGTNQIIYEGTADAHEVVLTAADATADVLYTLPDAAAATYGLMTSTLAANGVDIVNAVWAGTNQIIMEGATANAFETIITPTDATADRTITLPNISHQIAITETVTATNAITNAECGKTFYLNNAVGFVSTLPAVAAGDAGCTLKFVVKTIPTSGTLNVISSATEDVLAGHIHEQTASAGDASDGTDDTINFVNSTATKGDVCNFDTDGVNWYYTCFTGADGGIAVSKAD